jgi:hypothetical protein
MTDLHVSSALEYEKVVLGIVVYACLRACTYVCYYKGQDF